jgi:hypothetical protein
VGAVFVNTARGRPYVKSVVVMEYAITEKKGDIALNAAEVQYVFTKSTCTIVQNADGSRGAILSSLTPLR